MNAEPRPNHSRLRAWAGDLSGRGRALMYVLLGTIMLMIFLAPRALLGGIESGGFIRAAIPFAALLATMFSLGELHMRTEAPTFKGARAVTLLRDAFAGFGVLVFVELTLRFLETVM